MRSDIGRRIARLEKAVGEQSTLDSLIERMTDEELEEAIAVFKGQRPAMTDPDLQRRIIEGANQEWGR